MTLYLQTGEIPESEVDISLEVEQGLCNTMDKLLMIIHEFCNIYLECKYIPESHGCTVSSAAQLLCGLHQVMERREMEEAAESVSQHTAILTVLGLAISKHRECKLQIDILKLIFSYVCTMQATIFSHTCIAWLHIHNGICARSAIELLLVQWTDFSQVICQAMVGDGVLAAITNSLHWALDSAALTAVRT